ncbi:type III-A CRISPR-associated RAMP protein Csm5 [Deferribacteraceae bacterium V6Fe1]|nr:type III-A CRISPR-associated RAMP protein Csm5 [Deferribacteraceae bacterium V6Fe1]
MSVMKQFKISAYLASPIHIGTGDTLDPFSYVIKDKKLYRFDTSAYISKLESNKINQITQILKKPSLSSTLEARKFIYDNFEYEKMKDIIFEEQDLNKGSFGASYEKNLSSLANNDPRNKAMNQLEIEAIYSSGGVPIIPGSSIKGSIRTAIINKIIEDEGIHYNPKEINAYKNLMKNMNFSFTDDIFKCLKISDFSPTKKEVRKTVGYFLNFPKNSLDKEIGDTTMSVAAEVIMPFQLFIGEISVSAVPEHTYKSQFKKILADKTELFKCLNRHYLELFKKDYKLFESNAPKNMFVTVAKEQFLEKLSNNDYAVIKVGKHSGAEGVTFKERAITIKGNKKRQTVYDAKEPGTVWYFSRYNSKDLKQLSQKEKEIFPLGWMVLI